MRFPFFQLIKALFTILILVAIGYGGYYAYSRLPMLLKDLSSSQQPPAQTGQEVIVTIPKGASLGQITSILHDHGIISNRLVFRIVAMIRGEQRNIKAGDYALRAGTDPGEVLDQLISGKTLMHSLTVPEGYDIYQIGELFQASSLLNKDDFLKLSVDPAFLKELGLESNSLEGYLFPDTYFFRYSERSDPKLIIRKMVQRFNSIYDKHVKNAASENGWTMNQVITLASLIEKEARSSEHQFVSAVFHNRLKQNMRLQSDPTVIYGIKSMGSKITRDDLNRKHPYNTYQNFGLPPGPICNPGKESLIAAVSPADVDYLYFVARNDGSHQFSSSLKEHNKWVNTYQRNKTQVD